MICMCRCGCSNVSGPGQSGYCRRCQVGDCPSPDEDIPEACPECGGKSNKACIDEFGWCLQDSCTSPENTPAHRLAMRRGY